MTAPVCQLWHMSAPGPGGRESAFPCDSPAARALVLVSPADGRVTNVIYQCDGHHEVRGPAWREVSLEEAAVIEVMGR